MGFRQAMALIGNARQATSEGKSGPVETGLTGPAATALTSCSTEPSVKSFTKFLNTSDMHSASGCASQTLRKPRSRVGTHSSKI